VKRLKQLSESRRTRSRPGSTAPFMACGKAKISEIENSASGYLLPLPAVKYE